MFLKRIFLPKPNINNSYSTFENQLDQQYYFDSTYSKNIFENNKDFILSIVEKEIFEYITDDDLCNDEEGMFPKRSVLTGEWYIRKITFDGNILSIHTAFLGTDLGYKDDYLGLEIVLIYDRQNKNFIIDGVNSSSL